MRAPYELYIQAQIITNKSLDKINDFLYEIKLPPIPEALFKTLVSDLYNSKIPKQIKEHWTTKTAKPPKGYAQYMASVGLQEAVEKSPEYLSACKLFEDTTTRMALNCLIILKQPHSEIDLIFKKKFATGTSSELLRIYGRYFLNLSAMSRKDWPDFLRTLLEQEQDVTYKALSKKYIECMQSLELPVKISVVDHYQKLHVIAMEKFAELTKVRGANTDTQALKWAQLAMAAGDKFEKLKAVDIMDFSKEIQLQFEHVDVDFPMIGDDSD